MTLDIGPDLGPGAVLPGGYRVEERIGSGGMGVVYRAVHESSGAEVAVKVLRHGTTDRRFLEEGRVLAVLDHPGLVRVLDEGDLGDQPFLVLEYVPGPTLRELLELGPMRPDEVTRIGVDLATALAYVHAQDVVHRDVKPSNVLITPDGRPVLNDFGVAYRNGRTRWTESGFVNGTAAYLAPEQVLGEPPSAALDVYALGLVLLECLTGVPEYDGTAIECAVARLHRPPQRPATAPDWLADVLLTLTSTDPAQRPTAAEAAELLAGNRLPSPSPVRARARAALLAGAAAVAVAGVAATALLSGSSTPDRTTGEPVPTQFAPVTADPAGPATHSVPHKAKPTRPGTAATHDDDRPTAPKHAPAAPNAKGNGPGHNSGSNPGSGPGLNNGKGKGGHGNSSA